MATASRSGRASSSRRSSTGAAGAVIEFVVIRRLYARPLDTILATWGISLVLVQLITQIYGPTQRFLDLPTVSATDVLGTPYATYRLILILLAGGHDRGGARR